MLTIAITGVTGHLGGVVAKKLANLGMHAKHLARSPERAPKLTGASLVKCHYEYSAESVAALSGVDLLFMVSAKESPNRLKQQLAFLDAAKEAGVTHIVYTSFYNARLNSTFTLARDHAATEAYIKEKGFTYTFLRDNFYINFFVDMACQNGELKGPSGNGKVSVVRRADLADVATEVLKNPERWANQTLNMTGPEELTLTEIAEQVTDCLGISIDYVEETITEAYASRKKWRADQWEYDSWVSTYTAIANGEQAGLSDDIERVLGRKPASLRDYLKSLS